MSGVTSMRVRAALAPTLIVAVLGLSACDSGTELGRDGAEPLTLTVSTTFRQSDPGVAATRVQDLTDAIAELRDATSSGWIGRQDDVTGYLSELAGGRYQPDGGGNEKAAITGLMDEYGGDLFGVEASELTLGQPTAPTIADVVSVRADQELQGVPVVDGELVFSLEVTDASARVNTVRGRVFPALSPVTAPTIGARAAAQTARAASGGVARGTADPGDPADLGRPARLGRADRLRDLGHRRREPRRDLLRRRPDRCGHRRPGGLGRGLDDDAVVVPVAGQRTARADPRLPRRGRPGGRAGQQPRHG